MVSLISILNRIRASNKDSDMERLICNFYDFIPRRLFYYLYLSLPRHFSFSMFTPFLIFSCYCLFGAVGGLVVSILYCIRPDISMGPETIYPATPGQRASHRTVSNAGTKPVIGNQYLSYAIPLPFFSFYHSFSACPLYLSSPSVSFSPHHSLSPSRYLSTNYVNGAKQPNH